MPILAFLATALVCQNYLVALLFGLGTWLAGMSLFARRKALGFLAAGTIAVGCFICFDHLFGLAFTALCFVVAVVLIAQLH